MTNVTALGSRAVIVEITERKECQGHRVRVGLPTKNRDKIRKLSEKKLAEFAKKSDIKEGFFTDMTVTKKGKKEKLELFINFEHKDDAKKCKNCKTVKTEKATPVKV